MYSFWIIAASITNMTQNTDMDDGFYLAKYVDAKESSLNIFSGNISEKPKVFPSI